MVNLLAGSLIGAWIGANWATKMRAATLYKVIAVLLVFIAAALATTHLAQVGTLHLQPLPRTILGVAAGVGIGIVAAVMGVAGGELLIPTIVLLYGVQIKIAGSLCSWCPYRPCSSPSPATAGTTASKPYGTTNPSFWP